MRLTAFRKKNRLDALFDLHRQCSVSLVGRLSHPIRCPWIYLLTSERHRIGPCTRPVVGLRSSGTFSILARGRETCMAVSPKVTK